VSVYSEMSELIADWTERLRARGVTFETGMAEVAKEQADFWRVMMSGRISARQLRRMGHPFGRGSNPEQRRLGLRSMRGAAPAVARRESASSAVPKLPINAQTGWLRNSVRAVRTPEGWSVQASAPHAKFILHPLGTRKMVGRGFVTGRLLGGSLTALGIVEVYFRRQLRELRRLLAGT
jgi:hypothetical protein